MEQMKYLLASLRPKQWVKNLIVFACLIFSKNAFEIMRLLDTACAFILFCLASSCIYLINDLIDSKTDALHPTKKDRPIASGKLNRNLAWVFLLFALPLSLILSFFLSLNFFLIILAYYLMMAGYVIKFKNIIILDAFIISIGYVLRGVAGAVVINVEISFWFYICAFLLALFIVFCKRRHELLVMKQWASIHKMVLKDYSEHLLDQFISIITATVIISYSLYTYYPETVQKFHTRALILSIPFVVYGLFRYLFLVYKEEDAGSAENLMFADWPLIINMLLWFLVVFCVIYLKISI